MVLFHGTSGCAAENIMANGFNPTAVNWICSRKCHTYFVDANYDGEGEWRGFEFAIDSALLCCAISGETDARIGVIKLVIPDELAESAKDEYICPDSSCENMTDCYEIDTEWLNTAIANGDVKVFVSYHDLYKRDLRVFYLAPLVKEYVNIKDNELREVINHLSSIDFYNDDLYEYMRQYPNYEEVVWQ